MGNESRTTAIADVYAADTASVGADAGADGKSYTYSVEADPDPDVLSRVAGVCNLANVAPRRMSLERLAGDCVKIDIELDGISESTADSIRRKLLQLTCVTSVSFG
jgi:hypothetical protein